MAIPKEQALYPSSLSFKHGTPTSWAGLQLTGSFLCCRSRQHEALPFSGCLCPGGGSSQDWEQDCLGPQLVGHRQLESPVCSSLRIHHLLTSLLPQFSLCEPSCQTPTCCVLNSSFPRLLAHPQSTDLQRLVHFSVGKLKHTRARALPKVKPGVKAKPGLGPRFPSSWFMQGDFFFLHPPPASNAPVCTSASTRGAELFCLFLQHWTPRKMKRALFLYSGPVSTSPWPDEPPGGPCTAVVLPRSPSLICNQLGN